MGLGCRGLWRTVKDYGPSEWTIFGLSCVASGSALFAAWAGDQDATARFVQSLSEPGRLECVSDEVTRGASVRTVAPADAWEEREVEGPGGKPVRVRIPKRCLEGESVVEAHPPGALEARVAYAELGPIERELEHLANLPRSVWSWYLPGVSGLLVPVLQLFGRDRKRTASEAARFLVDWMDGGSGRSDGQITHDELGVALKRIRGVSPDLREALRALREELAGSGGAQWTDAELRERAVRRLASHQRELRKIGKSAHL